MCLKSLFVRISKCILYTFILSSQLNTYSSDAQQGFSINSSIDLNSTPRKYYMFRILSIAIWKMPSVEYRFYLASPPYLSRPYLLLIQKHIFRYI